MRAVIIFIWGFFLTLGVAHADESADAEAWALMQERVEDTVLMGWAMTPEIVVDEVIFIGFGYGQGNAVTPGAIEARIEHSRAEARTRAFSDLLQADLDGDLTVTRAEVDAVDLALSGYGRGQLWTRHRRADSDRDGMVTLSELRGYADIRAKQYLRDKRARGLRDLMGLDLNRDGVVTVEEAEQAVRIISRYAGGGALLSVSQEEDA